MRTNDDGSVVPAVADHESLEDVEAKPPTVEEKMEPSKNESSSTGSSDINIMGCILSKQVSQTKAPTAAVTYNNEQGVATLLALSSQTSCKERRVAKLATKLDLKLKKGFSEFSQDRARMLSTGSAAELFGASQSTKIGDQW